MLTPDQDTARRWVFRLLRSHHPAMFRGLGLMALALLLGPGKSIGEIFPPDPAPLKLVRLEGTYVDHLSSPSLNPLTLLTGSSAPPSSFTELLTELDEVGSNQTAKHVLIDLSDPSLNLNPAQWVELHRHLRRLSEAGIATFAWLEDAGPTHYAVASACDQILMDPLGTLDIPSTSLSTTHFKDLLDLVGIQAETIRTGSFKGAVEPFIQSEMSRALRDHYLGLVQSLNEAWSALIATRCALKRPGTPIMDTVRGLQKQRVFTAAEASEQGLVDHLVSKRDLYSRLSESTGFHFEPETKSEAPSAPPSIFQLWNLLLGKSDASNPKPGLAMVHLSGQIISGTEEMPGYLVSGPTAELLTSLAEDESILGVVVRINSPGGSVTASEAIRQALLTLAEKKPLVLSMGEMAASGGYWISCIDRPIFAEPSTITGSIGVFGLHLNLKPMLNRLGIQIHHVALDESATHYLTDHPWSEEERITLQNLIEHYYDNFLELVSTSRNLPLDRLDGMAQGRVWTGRQALGLGLVDHLGGMDTAITHLTQTLNLPVNTPVRHFPRPLSFIEAMEKLGLPLSGTAQSSTLPAAFWSVLPTLQARGFQLRFPLFLLQWPDQLPRGPQGMIWALHGDEILLY